MFVYGTLLPGELRWPFLEPFVDGAGLPDVVIGGLFDTGVGYPAFRSGGDQQVHGMTFALRVSRRERALETLDAVEGAVEGLYRRVRATTGLGLDVWVYEYGGGLELTPIPSGNWLRR